MIRLLLLAYPRAWRHRYGDELAQLIDDAGLGWRGDLDVISAGVRERWRSVRSNPLGDTNMTIGPDWRHPTSVALVALLIVAPTLMFVVGSVLAYQLGVDALRSPMDAVNHWLVGRELVDLVLLVSPVIALLLAVAPLVRLDLRTDGSGHAAVVGVRLRLANVLVGGTALAVGVMLAWHVIVESALGVGR